jgi:hypothetical protein
LAIVGGREGIDWEAKERMRLLIEASVLVDLFASKLVGPEAVAEGFVLTVGEDGKVVEGRLDGGKCFAR